VQRLREHLDGLKERANLRIDDAVLAGLGPVAGLKPVPAPPAATGHQRSARKKIVAR
jgi:hypothetical protein